MNIRPLEACQLIEFTMTVMIIINITPFFLNHPASWCYWREGLMRAETRFSLNRILFRKLIKGSEGLWWADWSLTEGKKISRAAAAPAAPSYKRTKTGGVWWWDDASLLRCWSVGVTKGPGQMFPFPLSPSSLVFSAYKTFNLVVYLRSNRWKTCVCARMTTTTTWIYRPTLEKKMRINSWGSEFLRPMNHMLVPLPLPFR